MKKGGKESAVGNEVWEMSILHILEVDGEEMEEEEPLEEETQIELETEKKRERTARNATLSACTDIARGNDRRENRRTKRRRKDGGDNPPNSDTAAGEGDSEKE